MGEKRKGFGPLSWVPTAYIAEGIPFAMVIWVAGTMFKDLGHSDTEITLATASVGIAWSLKPLWAAFLDMARTKKFFVLSMEALMAGLLAAMGLALTLPNYFAVTLGLMWVLAFASATQDICVDGVYITSLDEREQARWIGVQGMAWNLGRILATAVIVGAAGVLQTEWGYAAREAWGSALFGSAGLMAALALYHALTLPTGALSKRPDSAAAVFRTFGDTLRAFFRKEALFGMLAFVFLFRSAEGLLLVEAPLFLRAPLEQGGVGLSLTDKSWIDGTVGTVLTIAGGLLGGMFVARHGLKKTLFVLALCVNVPNLCYVYLSYAVSPDAPLSFSTVCVLAGIEKFGYGFGFVGNMLYMMQQIAPGPYRMTHYAFATALMNLVLVPTQMISGPLADWLGYQTFFVVVMLATVPSLLAAWWAPFPVQQGAEEPGDDAPELAVPAGEVQPG